MRFPELGPIALSQACLSTRARPGLTLLLELTRSAHKAALLPTPSLPHPRLPPSQAREGPQSPVSRRFWPVKGREAGGWPIRAADRIGGKSVETQLWDQTDLGSARGSLPK